MQKEINERSICVKELTKINIDIYLEESIQNLKNFIISEEDEFNIDGYRFIHKNKIDEIMQKEMEENGNMAIDVPKEVLKKYLDIPNHILDIMLKKNNDEAIHEFALYHTDKLQKECVSQRWKEWYGYQTHFGSTDIPETKLLDYYVFY